MRRLALLLAALFLVSACGEDPAAEPTAPPTPTPTAATPTAEPPTPTAPAPTPTETSTAPAPTPTATEEPTGQGATTATAYLVRVGDSGFWVEPVTTTLDEPTVAVARAAMELLVAGEAADPNLGSMAGPGVSVLGVDIDGDLMTVDLSAEIRDNASGGPGEAALAQQLAHTAAQFDGVERVRLLVDGGEISELWGHLDWSEPVEPEPFAVSPITFDSHEWGAQVPAGEVTVGGEANTFEANVQLRLLGPEGDVVEETFTTATSGSGERGTWEHTFVLEGAGTWTIEAFEDDPSDGEGRPPFSTTLELRSG